LLRLSLFLLVTTVPFSSKKTAFFYFCADFSTEGHMECFVWLPFLFPKGTAFAVLFLFLLSIVVTFSTEHHLHTFDLFDDLNWGYIFPSSF